MPAPIAPWMPASEALTIWMLRTAMKAPSVEPTTAIHILSEPAELAASSTGAREIDGGLLLRVIAGAVMAARSMGGGTITCCGVGAAHGWPGHRPGSDGSG